MLGFEFSEDGLLESLKAGGEFVVLRGLFGVFSCEFVDGFGLFEEHLVELLIFCL